MNDEIELMAQIIHKENPITIDGQSLDWAQVVQSHPDRAAIYREAARNRLRAADAMKRLDAIPSKSDSVGTPHLV